MDQAVKLLQSQVSAVETITATANSLLTVFNDASQHTDALYKIGSFVR